MRWIVLVLLCGVVPLGAFENSRLTGEWVLEEPLNILGAGREKRVVFEPSGAGEMSLTFKIIRHAGVGQKAKPVAPLLDGPHRLKSITANELIYVKNGQELHVTIRLTDQGLLEWGAVVSEDNRHWRYAREVPAEGGQALGKQVRSGIAGWTFLADPFEDPVGRVEVPGLELGTAFYIHEKLPSYETGGLPHRVIRIMTRNEDRSLSEQFRMVWDESGSPRVTGVVINVENLRTLITTVCHRVDTVGK